LGVRVIAESAYQIQYRQEFIYAYEDRLSVLPTTTTREAVIKGNQATFLLANSGSATAVTRGANGLIQARADNLTQTTATLNEWHDLVRRTDFNLFASQGDGRRIMQETTMGVINRKIDADIIAQLDTATINTTPAATASVAMVMTALAELGLNKVKLEDEENMFGVISPSFWAYMMQTPEFNRGDYVDMKWFAGRNMRVWRWAGINWIRHASLTGVGTASEKCYVYHKDAIGHAMDKERLESIPGFNEEQAYWYVRTSGYFGSKMLLNSAVVQLLHDGSAHNLS